MVASIMKDGEGSWLCTTSHQGSRSWEMGVRSWQSQILAPNSTEQFVESPKHLNPVPQLLEVQLLVRGMQAIVGQADAGQDHRCAGRAEGRHDGYGAAGARGHRAPPRDLLERLIEQLERGVIELDLCRIGAMQKPYARGDMLRREPLDRGLELPLDRLELLVGNEPHADFRSRFGGNHRLGTFAGEPTENAVDLERGQCPQALEHGVLFETNQAFALDTLGEEVLLVERELLPRRELRFRRTFDRPIHAGNVDAAILALEPRQ